MALRLIFSLAMLGWLHITSAATGQNLPPQQAAVSLQPDTLLSVDEVVNEPASWAGKKVKVTGNFSGWQGKCTGRPPVSRSDWMIESDTACVYVNGRLPPELSSIPPTRGMGKPIVVLGEIVIDEFGKPFIQSEGISVRE